MDQAAISTEPPSALDPPKAEPAAGPPNLAAILSIPVTVQVVLGSTSLPVSGLMKLARGAIVARGEIVVVDDASQRFGVSLLEVVAGADFKQPSGAPQESGHA
jgi:flagellar motor switch protein FliN